MTTHYPQTFWFLAAYWKQCNELPTVEEIEKVWDLPQSIDDEASEEEKAECARKVQILTWYLDDYLEKCVGLEYWGPSLRCFNLLTDKKTLDNISYLGENMVLVTITSEAYAQVLYKNCRDKWLADLEFFKSKGGKKVSVPKCDKDKPDTHKHQNLWSNSRTGAVAGGGWAPEAMEHLNERIKAVQTFRKQQAKEGNKLLLLGQNLIKTVNEINLTDAQTSGTKRKNSSSKQDDSANKKPTIIVLEE